MIVADRELSLAIGKEGQNARLAARLTGWRIDIKSESQRAAGEAAAPGVFEPTSPEKKAKKTTTESDGTADGAEPEAPATEAKADEPAAEAPAEASANQEGQ